MELELHQLELRYGELRARRRERRYRLEASLEEHGQQQPIVVVPDPERAHRYVVIDGHLRIELLRHLHHDTVEAVVWEMGEAEALVLQWQMSQAPSPCALEQGWLLAELQHRFGWSQEELARRFQRSASWVSRRLGLVRELPLAIQESIRQGRIPAQAAMKALVPLARMGRGVCEQMAQAIERHQLTSPEIQALYGAWQQAGQEGRQRLLEDPRTYLRVRQKLAQPDLCEPELFLQQVQRLARQAQRLGRQLPLLAGELSDPQRGQLRHTLEGMQAEWTSWLDQLTPPPTSGSRSTLIQETTHADSRAENRHPPAPSEGAGHTCHQEGPGDLPRRDQEGDRRPKSRATSLPAAKQGRAHGGNSADN